jgi:hypothetical protein
VTAFQTKHRGYRLLASAAPTSEGLHAANLTIEEPGRQPLTFNDLDFFYDGDEALSYATAWGRIWVETRAQG